MMTAVVIAAVLLLLSVLATAGIWWYVRRRIPDPETNGRSAVREAVQTFNHLSREAERQAERQAHTTTRDLDLIAGKGGRR